MKRKIKTTNYDGTIIEVEVNINIYITLIKKTIGRKIGGIVSQNKKILLRNYALIMKKMDFLLNYKKSLQRLHIYGIMSMNNYIRQLVSYHKSNRNI